MRRLQSPHGRRPVRGMKTCTRQIHQTHQANRVVNKNKMNGALQHCPNPVDPHQEDLFAESPGIKMRSTLVCGSGAGLYVMDRTEFAVALLGVISRYEGYGRGMRRRSRRGVNNSESTGKIGQEIPQNQPRPLVPSYLDEALPEIHAASAGTKAGTPQRQERAPIPQREPRQERTVREPQRAEWNEPTGSGRLEVETQPESPSVLPEAQAERAEKTPRGYVILAIGMPGSGKTTWFRRRGVTPLSSDLLRNILFDDVEEQKFSGLVFSTLRSLLRARLIAKMPWNYVDATNLSVHERRQWIKMSKSFGYEVQAVFFDVPLEVCLERNRSRDRMVSEDVMRKMAEKLKPPAFEEGFEKITVVRVKQNG
jgi:predicted kinase